jgi:hypothetical protein
MRGIDKETPCARTTGCESQFTTQPDQ